MKLKNPLRGMWSRGRDGASVVESKASKTASIMVPFGAGQPRFTPRQFDKLADEGYRKNIIAYRCVQLIARNAASIPLRVFAGDRLLENHPLIALLKQPNPMQGKAEFLESVLAYYLVAGNSYVEALRPLGGEPRELWALRPDRMRIIPGQNGMVFAYRYQMGTDAVDFNVDGLSGACDVLHLKTFHPLDDWYGLSPLEAAAFSVDQHNEAAKWNTSLLQSSGRPSGALVFRPAHAEAQDTLTDEQRSSLKAELEEFYTGGSNAGKPLVLEGGLDWREMSLSPKDMDWLSGKDVSAREIALAFHVPAQLIGIPGAQTYANFEQARMALYDDAVLPLLGHVCDELNHWLCPMFGDDIRIDFDMNAIDALAPRRAEVFARVRGAEFMTLNEKRQAVGLPPVEGGDVIVAGGA